MWHKGVAVKFEGGGCNEDTVCCLNILISAKMLLKFTIVRARIEARPCLVSVLFRATLNLCLFIKKKNFLQLYMKYCADVEIYVAVVVMLYLLGDKG